jgi:hypothetical protein
MSGSKREIAFVVAVSLCGVYSCFLGLWCIFALLYPGSYIAWFSIPAAGVLITIPHAIWSHGFMRKRGIDTKSEFDKPEWRQYKGGIVLNIIYVFVPFVLLLAVLAAVFLPKPIMKVNEAYHNRLFRDVFGTDAPLVSDSLKWGFWPNDEFINAQVPCTLSINSHRTFLTGRVNYRDTGLVEVEPLTNNIVDYKSSVNVFGDDSLGRDNPKARGGIVDPKWSTVRMRAMFEYKYDVNTIGLADIKLLSIAEYLETTSERDSYGSRTVYYSKTGLVESEAKRYLILPKGDNRVSEFLRKRVGKLNFDGFQVFAWISGLVGMSMFVWVTIISVRR